MSLSETGREYSLKASLLQGYQFHLSLRKYLYYSIFTVMVSGPSSMNANRRFRAGLSGFFTWIRRGNSLVMETIGSGAINSPLLDATKTQLNLFPREWKLDSIGVIGCIETRVFSPVLWSALSGFKTKKTLSASSKFWGHLNPTNTRQLNVNIPLTFKDIQTNEKKKLHL